MMSTPMTPAHGAPLALRCPKCAAEMVMYERGGIHVDQCRECRGIFLDRGELERLIDAESGGAGWAGPAMSPTTPVQRPPARDPRTDPRRDPRIDARDGYGREWFGGGDDDDWDDRRRGDDWDDRRRGDERGPRRRRSLLGELLEGLGD